MTSEHLTIASRFCGPPQSGNGGYTVGLLAKRIEGPSSVTLRAPPPLERPLLVAREASRVTLHDAQTLIAEAEPAEVELTLPSPVTFEQAELAALHYPGPHPHPYPRCFVCGTLRPPGDGLGIYAGPVADRDVVASPWIPTSDLSTTDGAVDSEFVCGALDCPSWFGYSMFVDEVQQSLLGRMAIDVKRAPKVGERCIVVAWNVSREGRRIQCGSMLIDAAHGDCLARATTTWITLKRPIPRE